MATGMRPRLGLTLQDVLGNPQRSVMPGDQPDFGTMSPGMGMQTPQQPKGGFFRDGGMGRYIAGAIGDALLQHGGMAPVFAPMQRDRQQAEAAEAQWHKQRMAGREDKQWEWQNKPQDPPPMVRDAQAWANMPEPLREAYTAMQRAKDGPIQILPNGMAIIRDPAIAAQIGVGGQGAPPQRNLGPVVDTIPGGPQARPAGTFRP